MRSRKGRHPQRLDRSTLTSSLNDMHLTVRKACSHDRVKALKTHGLFWFEFEPRWLLWSLDFRDWVCFFLPILEASRWLGTCVFENRKLDWHLCPLLTCCKFPGPKHVSTCIYMILYHNISKRTPLSFRDFVDHSLPKTKRVNCQRTMGGSTWWNHLLRLCQNFIDVLGVQVHP